MRVAVIGGGAAGLTAAWLLDEHHEVTLFEKSDRLGGHAHTIEVDVDGTRVPVDAGFQFFASTPTYAAFNRLLDALGVARETYPATLTVFGDARHPVVLPPLRNGRPVWASITPRNVGDMLRFRRFLSRVPAFLATRDTTVTIAEYIERQRLPKPFVEDFLLPLLLAFWCVELADFRSFAAYNALYYLGANLPAGIRAARQSEIRGGMTVYVDALVRSLRRTAVRTSAPIVRITRGEAVFAVEDADGVRHPFDHVVLATNARQALALLGDIPELTAVTRQLRRFEYFDTKIAIHGDRRLMPRHESAWSIVNARWDGMHSHLSIWNPAHELPIFKSWVTFDERMPEPLYAVANYEHGMITPAYFDAQERLRPLQGRHGLWLAGLYTHDADSHESAVRSAVAVTERLAPRSARLGMLVG